jgi:large subunit ribosomal protein L29
MAEKYGKSQSELNELDLASLVEELENAKQDALDSRFKLATGQLTDTARIGKIRRQIAKSKPLKPPATRKRADNGRDHRSKQPQDP